MHRSPGRLASLALASTLAVVLVAPVAAQAAPVVRVHAQDLDLGTPDGVAVLYARIRLAARDVCRTARPATGTRVPAAFTRCVRDAIDGAVFAWRLPALAALHDESGLEDPSHAPPPRRKTII